MCQPSMLLAHEREGDYERTCPNASNLALCSRNLHPAVIPKDQGPQQSSGPHVRLLLKNRHYTNNRIVSVIAWLRHLTLNFLQLRQELS